MDKEYLILHLIGLAISYVVGWLDFISMFHTAINAAIWSVVAIGIKALHDQYNKNKSKSKFNKS